MSVPTGHHVLATKADQSSFQSTEGSDPHMRLQEGQYETFVPTVRDRIVQPACKMVLEPIFEADFMPCSFGFRPRRAAHDGLQVLVDEAWRGRRWVVETDIANCFSAIPHEKLMQAVEERVCDQAVLKLLRVMLRAGVMQDGVVRRAATGTPRGRLCAAAHNPPCGVP
jgi:retron-type reverse transcriptase